MYDFNESELLSLCTSIGTLNTTTKPSTYIPSTECKECLEDIKILLRMSTEKDSLLMSQKIAEWQILQKDLVPLLIDHSNNEGIILPAVEILVALTWPVGPKQPTFINQQDTYLGYKETLLDARVCEVILQLLVRHIQVISEESSEEREGRIVTLLLSLIRNMFHIRDPVLSALCSNALYDRGSMQDRLLENMEKSKLLEFLLTLASSMDEGVFHIWNQLVLEIFYLMFLNVKVSDLYQTNNDLNRFLAEDLIQVNKNGAKGRRHQRFGGSVQVQIKPGKVLSVQNREALTGDLGKVLDGTKRNRRLDKIVEVEGAQAKKESFDFTSKELMISVAKKFNEYCLTCLVESIRSDLDNNSGEVSDKDYKRLFFVCGFFLEFFLLEKSFSLGENTSEDELEGYYRQVAFAFYPKFMSLVLARLEQSRIDKNMEEIYHGLYCLKELLLLSMDSIKQNSPNLREKAKEVQFALFFDLSKLDLVASLCKEQKAYSLGYLELLVETIHILLKVVSFLSDTNAKIIARKRRRKSKEMKKKKNEENETEHEDEEGHDEENEEFVERTFSFDNFFRSLATEATVITYCKILESRSFLQNERVLYYIAAMFRRIFVDFQLEALFFKLTILDLFDEILTEYNHLKSLSSYQRNIYDFIQYAVRRFFSQLSDYPFLLLEVFLSKRPSDCYRIKYWRDGKEKQQPSTSDHESEAEEVEREGPEPTNDDVELQIDDADDDLRNVMIALGMEKETESAENLSHEMNENDEIQEENHLQDVDKDIVQAQVPLL